MNADKSNVSRLYPPHFKCVNVENTALWPPDGALIRNNYSPQLHLVAIMWHLPHSSCREYSLRTFDFAPFTKNKFTCSFD